MKNITKPQNEKTAIVLFNLGGPDRLESIQPFLFNLFNDKAIIGIPQPFRLLLAKFISSKRAEKVKKIYEHLGGKSPLLDNTLAQAKALEQELNTIGNFRVFVAMRYWYPFAEKAVQQIKEFQPDQIILLPLYPQFSSATSDSSLRDFIKKLSCIRFAENFSKNPLISLGQEIYVKLATKFFPAKNPTKISIKTICCYPVEPDFINSHAILIKETISKSNHTNWSEFRFLFSAHGLPQKLINKGDPYVFHVTKTTEAVVEKLEQISEISATEIDFKICYQSKVGRLEWTGPSLEYELRRAALDKKIPVIIPISFVSEHSETLFELDVEYHELAQGIGIKNYLRVPALNSDKSFIHSLKKMVESVNSNHDLKSETGIFSENKMQRFCPKKFKFCPNLNPCKS